LCREGVFTRDVSGNPTQLIGVARDITVQRQADEKLRRNEQMMRRSFEDAPLGIALLSLSGQFESVNHSYCEIFGYRSSELVGESVAKVNGCEELEGFVEWLYGASSEPAPEPYRRERKAVRKDGVVAYVSEVASVVYDVNGKPSQIISQVQDITSRREAEERVGESDRRFQAALEALEDGVLLVDSSGLIQVANPTASELVGIAAEELLGTSIHDAKWQLVDELGNELPNEDRPLSRALCGERIEGLELRLQRPDETCFWIRVSAIPLYRDGFEQPYAAVASFLDISVEVEQRDHLVETMSHINDLNMQLAVRQRQLEEHQRDLEETNHQLQYLAVTDGLTGLRNHRRAQEFLDERVAEATRYNRPISIAMLDVDRFKQLNDDFGHLVGDKVLKELGRLLKAYIRNTDFVARYGGEEFLIVMPETCADAARSAAERIRRAIEGATWEERPITVSIGVATLGSATKTKELLLKQADRALYESKAAGRNCVSSYVAMRAHQAA
ncbi:MAG TPA: diguanylate cyclase, partial [Fimbriimonas sp.]|nr:diguanylate cyclase [Fimbriimonas sp.]